MKARPLGILALEGEAMNLYLLFFSLYSALIAPLSVRWSLRLGPRAGFGVRLQLAGFPMMRKRKPDDLSGESPIREREVARSLGRADIALFKAALSPALRRRVRSAVQLKQLAFYARFSCRDACQTALWYAFARELLRALSLCVAPRGRVEGRAVADFSGTGTEILFRGIIDARLGSLILTAALFAALYARARLAPIKEEMYAAASH